MSRLVEEGSGTVRECWSSQLQLPLCTLPAVCWFAFNADGRLGMGREEGPCGAVRCVVFVSEGNAVGARDGDDWVDRNGFCSRHGKWQNGLRCEVTEKAMLDRDWRIRSVR